MEEALVALTLILMLTILVIVPLAGLGLGIWGVLWSRNLSRRLAALEARLAEAPAPAPVQEPVPDEVLEDTAVHEALPASLSEAAGDLEVDPPTDEAPLPLRAAPDDETVLGDATALLAALEAEHPDDPPTEEVSAKKQPPPRPPAPSWRIERVLVWIGAILGGFLVLLAALFALVVTLERGWLGPPVRISLGLMSGTALWTLGSFLRGRSYRLLVSSLYGAGLGILYGTLFAATGFYGLLSSGTAFALMSAVTLVAMAVSVRHRDRFMAHLGLVGGLLTPVLVSTGENHPVGLFSYLALLSAGALVGASRRRWWDVALVAALGDLVLYVGWTASWYQADQVPVALLSALALTLPFALVALASPRSRAVAGVSLGGASLLALAAAPWLVPVQSVFWDPRTGVELSRAPGLAAWWAAGGAALLVAPAWLAARVRRWWPATLGASVAASLLGLVLALGWVDHFQEPALATGVGILGALGVALALHTGSRRTSWGLLPLPLAAGLALVLVVGPMEASGPVVMATTSGLVLGGALLALSTRQPWLLLPTLAGTTLALLMAAVRVGEVGGVGWVAGPATLAFAVLGTFPLLTRQRSLSAVLTAALAGPALFLPLYWCWEHATDGILVGVLPLLMAAVALAGAATLVRRFRASRSDWGLALFVGVALAGITAAIPLELTDQWLTLTWALEALALVLLARYLTHPLVRWVGVALALTVAVRLLVNPWALSYGSTEGWPILNWTLYTWGVPALALLLTGRLLQRPLPAEPRWFHRLDALVPPTVVVLGLLVGFALVHVQVSHLFQDAGPIELAGHGILQGMVRSLAWAAYGVVVLVAGLISRSRSVRLVGFALVLVATAKVFVVDLWALSGFVRVGSVLGLGVSLLLAAFLFERLVLRSTSAEDT